MSAPVRRVVRDERGAIMVMSTSLIVVAMICSALAVDLGRLADLKRFDQKVADLAAMDASRDLTQACDRAQKSAVRNDYPGLSCSDVVIGTMSGGTFTPNPSGDAVQVKASSPFKTAFPFVTGPSGVNAKAVASQRGRASFSLGSGVASIDTNRSTLLNSVIGQMLCSPVCASGNAALSLVSWQGLASGGVSLQALQTSLATAGFSVGTVSQLLSANMTLAQLYTATASALTTGGDAADASIFNALVLKATSAVQVNLGKLISVAQGGDAAALATRINLFQLVTGSAEVANGNHAIDVPNVGITVGNVTSTRVQLTVIEPPVIFIGAYGDPGVSTAQVNVTVTPTINLGVTSGINLFTVGGALPIQITGGSATGTLAAKPVCASGANSSFQVAVTTQAGSVTQTAALGVTLLGAPVGLLNVTGNVTVGANSGTSPTFAEQGTTPQSFSPSNWHFGGTSLGLGAAIGGTGSGGVGSALAATLTLSLGTVVGNVDSLIVEPLLTGLGLDIGNADVVPLAVSCGQPSLVSAS